MQGLTEPKVRKVTSKLILKPEELPIPAESLNVILDVSCDFDDCDDNWYHLNNSENGLMISVLVTIAVVAFAKDF